jgi:hypothetical protein
MTNPLLYDVNLQTCPDAWLCGQWRVRRRGPGPGTVFSLADELVLNQVQELLVLGPHLSYTGRWTMERDPRLGRPFLTFILPQERTRALITRLQRAPDGQSAAITLYLETGTELVLHGTPVA